MEQCQSILQKAALFEVCIFQPRLVKGTFVADSWLFGTAPEVEIWSWPNVTSTRTTRLASGPTVAVLSPLHATAQVPRVS